MKKFVKKSAVAGAAVATVFAGSLLTAAPAHAGGPGSQHVDGASYGECQAMLSAAIGIAVGGGARVSGVYNCFNGGGHWYGGFVAND